MIIVKKTKTHNKITVILNGFVALVIVIMILQDYLTYLLFYNSYYLSESLLFKINIVLLFIPIFIFNTNSRFYIGIKLKKEINISTILAYLIPISIVHILIASFLIAFISQNLMESPYTFWFLIKNKFTNDFVFILTMYGLMYLIFRYYLLNIKPQVNKTTATLSIKDGTKFTVISVADIDWIAAETPYVGIWVGKNKYLYTSTLASVLLELDNTNFIRIHRSTIVNKTKIKNIQSRANGDYDLSLSHDITLRLSRNYRKSFNTQFK
jgi:hypothetical protein